MYKSIFASEEKVARKIIESHDVKIMIVDFSKDKDEPAYDVEVWINGKPTMGGKDKQIFGIGTKYPSYQYPTKEKALAAAKERVKEILMKCYIWYLSLIYTLETTKKKGILKN